MSHVRRLSAVASATLIALALGMGSGQVLGAAEPPAVPVLATPAQDQGLPYTRSGKANALAAIKDGIAVFAGSRYAYVRGAKVRLDDVHWRDEARLIGGKVYVPEAFAPVVLRQDLAVDAAPAYLADRWVHTIARPATPLPAGVATAQVDGRTYVELSGLAGTQPQATTPAGLHLVGVAQAPTGVLADNVTTLFDTPERLADPALAARTIPTLARQGQWTDHVKVTPEQLAVYTGPATVWPTAPKESFDFTGFDQKVLGSPVPAPGVYPRVLFSPEDVPAIAARVKGSKVGQASLLEMEHLFKGSFWDPATSDGKVFAQLASGNLAGLEWVIEADKPLNGTGHQFKDQKQGIHNSHVAYVPECLTSMALYCLLTGDDAHGRMAAAAIASYYKLREPLIDRWNATTDSEFGSGVNNGASGSSTAWRGMHGLVAHMNLGLALDFSGKWMTTEDKETMRRVIAKATYGRRAYGQDAPVRFRDVNWVTWDLPHYLALTAIEGLEGCDPEALESNRDTVRAFCDWGIDDHGVVYESNGKTPGSFQFFTLSLVISARRGENLFGHPHLRKLLTAQTQMTSPTGRTIVNSGTQYAPYSRQMLSLQLINELKTFYPGERVADFLLSQAPRHVEVDPPALEGLRSWILDTFTPESHRAALAAKKIQRLRLPSPTYPGFVRGVLFDTDWQPTTRADLKLPLDFSAPVHGVFASRSGPETEATWTCLMVRPDHYMGAGHHHADAGMVHVSALGVDWLTQSRFHQSYDGHLYSLVTVDGQSEPVNVPGACNGYNGAATYLGSTSTEQFAAASADLTYAYSWRWMTQPPQVWSDSLKAMGWEIEPSERILKIYAGTARDKIRPWWSDHLFTNYIPTLRAPFNPMQRVFRSTALVRGAHPYVVVVDDVKKDDQARRYEWVSPLAGGVWKAEVAGLAANQVALAYRPEDPKTIGLDRPAIAPQAGEPLLLVTAVGLPTDAAAKPSAGVVIAPGPADKKGAPQTYERLVFGATVPGIRFTMVFTPVRAGQPLPAVTWDAARQQAAIAWPDQQDALRLATGADQRTRLSVERAGKELGATP